MPKTEPTKRPIVCVEIEGGNVQAIYRLGGVGLPVAIIVDWDNINDGDDDGLEVHRAVVARVRCEENEQARNIRLAIENARDTAAKSRGGA